MKTIAKITVGLTSAAILIVGCMGGPSISEESLGLRKSDLYTEKDTVGDKTNYSKADAGSGVKIQRAFQDAPPMIPHNVEGLLPITINNNQCVSCHMPEVATDMGATPIPSSHFLDMRPVHKFDGKTFTKSVDTLKNETSIKKIDKLAGARFNCTQCHAPQSQGDLVVENTFEPAFTSQDGASKSSWSGTKLLEGLDTINQK